MKSSQIYEKGAGETAGGKKRRARATPEQLEILNQVYARTPFPSTQERIDLAAVLGMTPRSVQIWYIMISFTTQGFPWWSLMAAPATF